MVYVDKSNFFHMLLKGGVFVIYALFIIFFPETLIKIFNLQILFFKLYHLIWAATFIFILGHLIKKSTKMSSGKIFKTNYNKNKNTSSKKIKTQLKTILEKTNRRARRAFFAWIFLIILFWIIYFSFNLNSLWIYFFIILLVFLDTFSMTIWCPFRDYFIKNRCCNTCRICDWGYWMIFLPLLAIPSFWTYSLIILSIIIFLRWEFIHYKHPERFYELTNSNLSCENCRGPSGFCKKRSKSLRKRWKKEEQIKI